MNLNSDTVKPHIVPIATYLKVFAALGVLLAATVLVAEFDFGHFNTPIALAIGMAKAALIMLFFMHIRYASALVRLFAVGAFLWLAILFIFTFSDYLTRH